MRPNDRGKEVLSFVVYVDPGKGKDGWKVEKMYSDVLGLDQRVRSSVAKGVGKKIASLPEGKLWKDHAPAKVDQRKVCVPFLTPCFSDRVNVNILFSTFSGRARELPTDAHQSARKKQRRGDRFLYL